MIETARLKLRPYATEDAAALVAVANTRDVARMMESIRLPFTLIDAQDRIAARFCSDLNFTFAIVDGATGELIGEIGAGGTPNPRLGYFLRPDQWGKGYASEAIAAALEYGFVSLDWPVIDADCFDDNPASVRTLEKAGFVRTGSSNCTSQAREGESPTSLFRTERTAWLAGAVHTI